MGVDFIIWFYMFICVALLVFNVLYILRGEGQRRRQARSARGWLAEIESEGSRLEAGGSADPVHSRRLELKLAKVEELMAYQDAMLQCMEDRRRPFVQRYLDTYSLSFQSLAVEYGKYPPMERAFYAHVMSIYCPNREQGGGRLVEILMSYFDDSTVFCRENILQALFAMGQPGPVEQAITLMSDRGWYHHTRLLSDGLSTFSGDREELAWRLWRRCPDWSESFQVSTVQFAADISGSFREEFLTALDRKDLLLETRFALLRYFMRHHYPPAKEKLLSLLEEGEESGLSIVAATVLARYPGEDTRYALTEAMHSRNWYIRRNAAASLVTMGATAQDADALRAGGDRYAAEMLEYMLEENARKQQSDGKAKVGVSGA